ncbi:MAG: glutathione S-transferase family protein [Rhodospirillales bacterium]|nr:glutathione S-transferase family protein [Rhodospirillales bacterium]
MILIGRLLSPFVRRVQISMNLLGIECERRPYGTATHADEISQVNPLRRVPALILDGGETLIDSAAILDYLDELVGPQKALVPSSGAERRKVLKLTALAVGAAEKGVVAFYEKTRRPDDKIWDEAVKKYREQILGGLNALENAVPTDGGWLVGPNVSQADITTAAVVDFVNIVLPDLIGDTDYPRLKALVARLNLREEFSSTHPSTE